MTATSRTTTLTTLTATGLAAAALLVGVPSPASAATATTVHTTADFGTFVEDPTPCTGEPVRWTGGYETVVTTVEGTSSVTRSLQYTQQLTGVGLTSGSSYLLNAHYHETFRVSEPGADVLVMPLTYVEITRDGNLNYLARELTLQVVAPDGTVVVDAGDGSHGAVTCVG